MGRRALLLYGALFTIGGLVIAGPASNAQTSGQPSAQKPGVPSTNSGDAPLSQKLDKNNGVLKPPNNGIDPEIHQPPPAKTGDKMPVIIPPGEPGGDQSIQPK